jgi:RHS repeat-associated protein
MNGFSHYQRLIGKEKDFESSLGDFGVRMYDEEIGRFTSIDPLWEK